MKIKKVPFIATSLASIIIMCLMMTAVLGCQQQPEKYTGPVEKITVAAAEYLTGALIYVAEDQGFFEENGLDVTIKGYGSGKACADALINGEVDISTSAGFVFVSNSFDYTDLRIFGTVATAQVKELIARKDKGITTMDDLVGKKIGVTRKSGAEFLFGVFLTFNALSYEDVELTLRALKQYNVGNEITVAHDGAEALDYLFATGAYADRDTSAMPAVVLLDLKLPKVDGFEVLQRMRADERTKLVPVVILTSSKEERDMVNGYELGANSYVRKPVDFTQFLEAARQLGLYWLVINEPPPQIRRK